MSSKNAVGPSVRAASSLQQVYDYIKDRILRLEFPPGQNLAEIDLVKKLRVSRTPVREALIKLASEGLVDMHQNRGAWVAEITLSDIRQFFEALNVSQRMVTRLAALRFDSRSLPALEAELARFEKSVMQDDINGMNNANYGFHAVIADNCGNALVKDHYLKLMNIGTRISHLALLYERKNREDGNSGLEQIVDEHRQMKHYIATGQADEAERLALDHVVHFRQRVLDFLASDDTTKFKVDT